jgi:predicted TIM-barrel fold metal-dependent hydrolase
VRLFARRDPSFEQAQHTDPDVASRFPTLKFIVGHMGERVPSDFGRISESMSSRKQLSQALISHLRL